MFSLWMPRSKSAPKSPSQFLRNVRQSPVSRELCSRILSTREGGIKMRQVIDTLTTRQELADQPFGSVEIKLSHLLAPTDFSPNSERAVDYAVQLARRLGTKLTLLHVVPEPGAHDYSMEG